MLTYADVCEAAGLLATRELIREDSSRRLASLAVAQGREAPRAGLVLIQLQKFIYLLLLSSAPWATARGALYLRRLLGIPQAARLLAMPHPSPPVALAS